MITENGAAYDDAPTKGADGVVSVHDQKRVAYLRSHIAACRDALDSGVPLRGYYVWSLIDNFEWEHGYSKRFGIVRVDYGSQERIVKDSGLFYKDIIARNGIDAR